MSLDRRRILGPDSAYIPALSLSTNKSGSKTGNTKPIDDVRKIFVKRGIATNANGSAYLEVGKTVIEVSLYGPRPIRGSFIDRATFSVETKFLPYVSQPGDAIFNDESSTANPNGRAGLTNIEQKISSQIETTLVPCILLEKYPKSSIDVFVTILSRESSSDDISLMLNLISWCINCCSLAMVDSGIEIKDIVTSGHARMNYSTGEVALDPVVSESDGGHFIDCIASFMALNNNEIAGFWIEGKNASLNEDVINKLTEGCERMSSIVRSNFNSFLLQEPE